MASSCFAKVPISLSVESYAQNLPSPVSATRPDVFAAVVYRDTYGRCRLLVLLHYLWVFAESSGRIQGMKAQESCAFVSELDFGEGFDLASEMDDKSGEATSATLGFVLLPGFSAGTDGMRRFR